MTPAPAPAEKSRLLERAPLVTAGFSQWFLAVFDREWPDGAPVNQAWAAQMARYFPASTAEMAAGMLLPFWALDAWEHAMRPYDDAHILLRARAGWAAFAAIYVEDGA